MPVVCCLFVGTKFNPLLSGLKGGSMQYFNVYFCVCIIFICTFNVWRLHPAHTYRPPCDSHAQAYILDNYKTIMNYIAPGHLEFLDIHSAHTHGYCSPLL